VGFFIFQASQLFKPDLQSYGSSSNPGWYNRGTNHAPGAAPLKPDEVTVPIRKGHENSNKFADKQQPKALEDLNRTGWWDALSN